MKIWQFVSILIGALSLSTACLADSKDDVLRQMAACADVSDSVSRLACFDGETPALKSAVGLLPSGPRMIQVPQQGQQSMSPNTIQAPAAPSAAATPAAPNAPGQAAKDDNGIALFGVPLFGNKKQQTTPADFGTDTLPAAERPVDPNAPAEVEKIVAKVTDYSLNPHGKFIVFLDNGQVWRQAESDVGTAVFKHNAADNSVIISRGAMASYNLRLNKLNRTYKVTRIK